MKIRKWTKVKIYKLRVDKLIRIFDKHPISKNLKKGEITMDNTILRPCTPEESLKQSLIEMKLMREGGLKKRSYWDAMEDFNEEDDE